MESFLARIEGAAALRPEARAVVQYGAGVSWGELWRNTCAAAACLHDRGVRMGDTVALSLEEPSATWLPSLTLLYALGYLGAVVLPLHPEVPNAGKVRLAARYGSRWMISPDPALDAAGAERVDPLALAWGDRRLGAAPRGDAPGRPFLYLFTSGSTGDPKVCRFDSGLLTAHRLQYAAAIGTGRDDCLAGALCWPTKVGLRTALRIHAAGGCFANLPFPESMRELGAMVREHGLTQLMCSPWQLRRLLADPGAHGAPPLGALQVGGGSITAEEILAARARITPRTYAVYAATELGVLAHIPPGTPPGAPGHAGGLLPHVQGEAVDENDRPLPAGVAGKLRFRTPCMPAGYAGNPAATAECFRAGWFYPGDLGAIDAAGNVLLQGRADDLINFGGSKIMPAALEAILAQHPDIEDVAVVGVADPMAGERPVAFAVFRRVPSGDDLERFCRARIDGGRYPREFVAVAQIPRSREGKILRGQLRSAHAAREGR